MRHKSVILCVLLLMSIPSFAQEENIVEIIDDLTVNWDGRADELKTYEGLKNVCRERSFRDELIILLDKIHHYDTVLFNTVTEKYSSSNDPEAKATLEDIEELERDYTTRSFKSFIHQECNEYNMVENSFGGEGEEYELEKKNIERQLEKYVTSITSQIDLIDEHVHHLKKL